MADENETNANPPYIVFSTFLTFLDKLGESIVPTKLDHRVLSDFSGSVRAALLPGLKFLGLIDSDNTTRQSLSDLVAARKAGDAKWHDALRNLLTKTYGRIASGVNLEKGTLGDIEKAFRESGIEGSTTGKAVGFYLRGMEEAGVAISPYMKAKRGPGPGGKRKPRNGGAPKVKTSGKPTGGESDSSKVERDDAPPSGFERLPIPGRPGAFIQFPRDLNASDVKLFKAQVAMLEIVLEGEGGPK